MRNKHKQNEAGESLKVIPLGGLESIGANMTVFEYGDDMIIVDCGIMFPTGEMPGIDFLIPDFSYVKRNKHKLRGMIITHGHEDHIGGVPFLLQELSVPVYGAKLTLGFIRNRLEERIPKEAAVLIEKEPRDVFKLGNFEIEFIRVNHSIVDGVALAIKTPVGTVIHTGDFKIDYSPSDGKVIDLHRFAQYGESGVLLLMSDSTNAERPGFTRSESVLVDKLVDIFSSAKGRIIAATFASNINRIQQILDAAQKYNRKVVISGRSMLKNIEIAESMGYITYKEGLIVDIKEGQILQDKRLVIICTGTQGEPMSALSRIAAGTHKHFIGGSGDTVMITASIIPGNERMVSNVINAIQRIGANVYYEQDANLHVSGHASQEELKMMIALTNPVFFMPIHGEYKMRKAHAALAESLKIKSSAIMLADNGDILEVNKKQIKKTGQIELARIYVDGDETGDLESAVIKERQTMSTDGLVVITIVTSQGMMLRHPDVIVRGLVGSSSPRIIESIIQDAELRAGQLLAGGSGEREISNAVKKSVKQLVFKMTRRNPLIEVLILET